MLKKDVNMTSGPIFRPIIQFAIPMIITGILQILFNAIDTIVVGQYVGREALAAVGSNGPITTLMINIFVGLSAGASVIMGNYLGANDYKNAKEMLETAMFVAISGGFLMMLIGILVSRPMLIMMKTPENVIELSTTYLKIYFLSMPGFMIYNFGSGIIRATGDTKRPMIFLIISGILNVVLNLIFVIVFKWGVKGVAIATVISQYLSGILVFLSFLENSSFLNLKLSEIHPHKDKLMHMFKFGIPAGLQGAMSSISNIMVQTGINSFGSVIMAANTAAANIESFVYASMSALYFTALAFISQNMGAKTYDRIKKIFLSCILIVTVIGVTLGALTYIFGESFLSLYTRDNHVIAEGMTRLMIVALPYFICGIMDTMVGGLRGMGYSFKPMIVSMVTLCGLRILWIMTIFKVIGTPISLYLSYPVTWILAILLDLLIYKGAKKTYGF